MLGSYEQSLPASTVIAAIPVADARFPMVLGWDVAGTIGNRGSRCDRLAGR
jgi:hypothetical protein